MGTPPIPPSPNQRFTYNTPPPTPTPLLNLTTEQFQGLSPGQQDTFLADALNRALDSFGPIEEPEDRPPAIDNNEDSFERQAEPASPLDNRRSRQDDYTPLTLSSLPYFDPLPPARIPTYTRAIVTRSSGGLGEVSMTIPDSFSYHEAMGRPPLEAMPSSTVPASMLSGGIANPLASFTEQHSSGVADQVSQFLAEYQPRQNTAASLANAVSLQRHLRRMQQPAIPPLSSQKDDSLNEPDWLPQLEESIFNSASPSSNTTTAQTGGADQHLTRSQARIAQLITQYQNQSEQRPNQSQDLQEGLSARQTQQEGIPPARITVSLRELSIFRIFAEQTPEAGQRMEQRLRELRQHIEQLPPETRTRIEQHFREFNRQVRRQRPATTEINYELRQLIENLMQVDRETTDLFVYGVLPEITRLDAAENPVPDNQLN